MTAANKQKTYVLLNDDLDFEEFDRSNVSLMHQSQKK